MDIQKQRKIEFEDKCILAFLRAGSAFVRIFPLSWCLLFAKGMGALIYATSRRKRLAYANLRAAFGAEKTHEELRRIARRSMQNMAMSAIELLRFPSIDQAYLDSHIRIRSGDKEKVASFMKSGQGIIFLTAHFGSWELLNAAGSLMGYQMAVLAKEQKHRRADEFLNKLRSSKGTQVIYKGIGVREILRSLTKGKIVGMLSDQDGGKKGVFVRFFGRMSSSPAGVATFAMRTGTPIFPVFIFREGLNRHRIEVEGPLSVPRDGAEEEKERIILQQFSEILEQKIRQAPDQWLWAHRRWKSTPNRNVLILDDGKAGHKQQSLAFLKILASERTVDGCDPKDFSSRIVTVYYRSKFHSSAYRSLGLLTFGYLSQKTFLTRWALTKETYDQIYTYYADVVISCGSGAEQLNLYAKRLNGAKSAVIMKPGLPMKLFDAVLAPRHDKIKKSGNLYVTKHALAFASTEEIRGHVSALAAELGLNGSHRRVGVLMGGDTDRMKVDDVAFEKLVESMRKTAQDSGVDFLVTSSRRTSSQAEGVLKKAFAGNARCPLLVIANETNRPNVVEAILGLSDVILVSLESVSMISQAISSGKTVIVFNVFKQSDTKPKFRRFMADLLNEEKILPADADNIEEVLKQAFGRSPVKESADSSDETTMRTAAKRLL